MPIKYNLNQYLETNQYHYQSNMSLINAYRPIKYNLKQYMYQSSVISINTYRPINAKSNHI